MSRNPQVFIWVSGHLHLAAFNRNCNDEKIYTYKKNNVKNIHNPALRGQGFLTDNDPDGFKKYPTLWTDSLYLYDDRVVIKTYDHGMNTELKELEKVIKLPVV
ncbi:hypothetical protein SDC9_86926 [bioreactor metagenome]|uniref:Uncharacterized protein n=1 Tax=bioreactor metagenome TaxID=1076179 RepID=A0A644ZHF9_9ZZZZ